MKFRIRDFFFKKFSNNYNISDWELLDTIIKSNRTTLSQVPKWLSDDVKKKSYFNYGVPDSIIDLIDLEIGNEITYTDLLVYYSSRHLKDINYLELGVSVGKNFLQVANQFKHAVITGFDIENINNVLTERFKQGKSIEWQTMRGSLRKESSSLSSYSYQTNKINYLAGDIWDENSWQKLEGNKFNIIFSDALHDPAALLWEYKMLDKYELIDSNFIFMWDDLNHGLEKSFEKIAFDLKSKRKIKEKCISLIKINGWLGQNYPLRHDVGIVSNFILD